MLSTISWQLFLTVVGVLLLIYYFFIAAVYYPKEIFRLVSGKFQMQALPAAGQTPVDAAPGVMGTVYGTAVTEDHKRFQPVAMQEVNDNLGEIKAGILTLIREIPDDEQCLEEINSLLPAFLAGYPQIAESSDRGRINDFMLGLCREKFSVEISPEDINDLW